MNPGGSETLPRKLGAVVRLRALGLGLGLGLGFGLGFVLGVEALYAAMRPLATSV